MLHGHGNDLCQYKTKIKADFSSNVWYGGASAQLLELLANNLLTITNYPEPDAYALRETIAARYQLKAQNVLVANGSTEAFYLIAQAFAGKRSTVVGPCFSEYADACDMHYHTVDYVENSEGWIDNRFEDRLVWFANPNNPDAKTISLNQIDLLLHRNPFSIFILDEAYIELCQGAESAVSLLREHTNLVIVKSLTKAFCIPGLRLGYVLASTALIDTIASAQMPWSVNSLAIIAGMHILGNYEALLPDTDTIARESVQLQNSLGALPKLKVYPSNANFFLVQSLHKPASHLKSFLVDEYGLLIRDASNFRGLDSSFFRIAIQQPDTNKLLVEAITQWISL